MEEFKVNKKAIFANAAVVLGLSSVFSTEAFASTINEMENQKTTIQQEREELQGKISSANEEKKRLEKEQSSLSAQLERLKLAAKENEKKVTDTEDSIKQTTEKIDILQKDIDTLNEKLEERNQVLAQRAKALQEAGGSVDYVQVLLGSQSFSDFVDRSVAVSTIISADRDILKETKEMQDEVAQKQSSVKGKLKDLEAMKEELKGINEYLAEQKAEQETLAAQLNEKKSENAQQVASLTEQETDLSTQEQTLTGSIAAEKQREQEQKEAAEKAEQQVATASSQSIAEKAAPVQDNESTKATSKATVEAPAAKSAPAASHSNVATVGNKWIGNSAYVFGGGRTQADINRGFFDCSSFVHWAYSQVGVELGPRGYVSTETLKHAGTQISASQMQPGDLVFFNTYKTDGHVGIYVGNGKFIGAQSKGVGIADMTQGYWKKKFNGRVVRI